MAEIFLIGDTHFGHKKVIEFESEHRPFATIEDHDDELVYRWNSVVRSCDTVWVLGDLLFGREAFETLKRLKGNKKLILGNHDTYPTSLYMEHFSKILSSVNLGECILTHIPIHPSQFRKQVCNIHGHLHSSCLDDGRYICVSAERVNLTPVSLSGILDKIR